MPQISVVIEPPSPELCSSSSDLRLQRAEIRRHSHHSPSLTVKQYDKEKDRRHSGFNPNLLGMDPEHMRFLNCSPAATRRISCGSLFKVCIQIVNPRVHMLTSVANWFSEKMLKINLNIARKCQNAKYYANIFGLLIKAKRMPKS